MNRLKKLLKNEYIYSVLTKFISLGLGLMQSILVARYLGSALQGSLTYVSSIVSIGSIVITFGMHQAYPYLRKEYGKAVIYQEFLSVIKLLFLIYSILVVLIVGTINTDMEIKWAIFLIPIFGYSRIMEYVCLVEAPNKRNFWWTIVNVIEIIFIIFLMLCFNRSFLSAIATLIFAELLRSIVYTKLLNARWCFSKHSIGLMKKLFKFGFFPMLALLMTTLNYKIDVLMLGTYDFISTEQIGIYSIGMTFADKVVLIPDTLKGVLVSRLSRGAGEREVAKVARISFWASVLIGIVFLIVGEPMIEILYGNEYTGAYSVLMICAAGSIFIGYFKLIAQYNIVNKMQIRNVVLLSISILINIILNAILIPQYQLNGAAIASGIGYFLSGMIFVIWFARKNNIRVKEMFLVQKQDMDVLMSIRGKKDK